MAKLAMGVLGGFSVKAGTVVGILSNADFYKLLNNESVTTIVLDEMAQAPK